MSNIVFEDEIPPADLPGRTLKWLFSVEPDGQSDFSMNIVVIAPGNTVKPAHAHRHQTEIVYIISGTGQAQIDGNIYDIRAGTAIHFEKGSVHMLRNSGQVDMKVVCFFTPGASLNDYTFFHDVEFRTPCD